MQAAHSISARSMPSMSTQQHDTDSIPRPPSATLARKSSIRAVPYDPTDTRLPLAPSLSGASTSSYSPSSWPFPKGHQRQTSKSKLPVPVDNSSPVRMAPRETSPTRKFAQRSVMRAAASAPSRQGSFHESSLRNETFSNGRESSTPDEERESDETGNGTLRVSQTNGVVKNECDHERPECLTRASASSLASRPKTPFPFSGPDDMPPERPTNPTPHAGLAKQPEALQDPRFTAEYFETISIHDHAPSPEPLTPPRRLSVSQSDSTDAMYGGSRQVSTFSTVHEVDEEDGDHGMDMRDTFDLERTMTFVQDSSDDQTFADRNIALDSSTQQDESVMSAKRTSSNPFGYHQNVDIGGGTPDRGIMLIDPNVTADLTNHNTSRVTSGSRMWTPLPNIDSIRRGPKIRHHRIIPEPGGGGGGSGPYGIAPTRSGIIPPVNTLADLAILGGNGSGNKLNDLEEQNPDQQEKTRRVMRLQKWLVPVSFGVLQASIISFVASIAVFASRSSGSTMNPTGIIAWISISAVLLISSLATFLFGACAVGRLRKQETGEDPWIEMHRLARALPPRPPAEKEGDNKADKKSKALAQEDKAATEQAWKKFADDQEQLRKYVEKLEQEILDIKEKREEEQDVLYAAQQQLHAAKDEDGQQQQQQELHPIGTAISSGDQTPDSKFNSHKQPTVEDCPDCPSNQPSEDEDATLTPKASKATQTAPRDSLIADNKPTYYTSGRRPRSNTTGTATQSLHRLLGPPSELDSGHFQRTGLGVPASNSGGTIASLNLHIHGYYSSPSRNGHGHNHGRNAQGDHILPNHTAYVVTTPSGVTMGVPISQTQSSILTELCEAVTLSGVSGTGSSTTHVGGIENYSPLGRDEISGAMKKAGVNSNNNGVTPSPSPRPSQSPLGSSGSAGAGAGAGAADSDNTRPGHGMPPKKKGMLGGVRAVTASDVAPEEEHGDYYQQEPMPEMSHQMSNMAKRHQQRQQYLSPELTSSQSQKEERAYYGTFRRMPSRREDVRGMEFLANPNNGGGGEGP